MASAASFDEVARVMADYNLTVAPVVDERQRLVIIATAETLQVNGIQSVDSAAQAATALESFAGRYAEALFDVGVLGASLLAAAILPIATSYVVAESLGFLPALLLGPIVQGVGARLYG